MFNYVYVEFPNSSVAPKYVHNLTLHQNRYHHEIAVIQFRDWNVDYDAVSNGSPIYLVINDGVNKKEFRGYVDTVLPNQSPSKNITEITAVSPSYKMKTPRQTVYKDLSADGVIQQIASEYRFNAFTLPHPRIYPQISQAGYSDWEFMVYLAKQSGYSLRTENTEIYLQPMLYEYANKRSEAPRFIMRDSNNPAGSTLYSFDITLSETNRYDGEVKAAVAVSGLDEKSNGLLSITQQKRTTKTKNKVKPEFFDKFATDVVATDPTVAGYEAEAAEQRAIFQYRGDAKVIGNATLRPDMPVFLEGAGSYSGYWVVLGTEHIVEEQQRNVYMYTTILHLGTDSLGEAAVWEDGKRILSPDYEPKRTLIPGVRQTNTPPTSSLLRTAPNIGPQSTGNFSTVKNRAVPNVNNRSVSAPSWVAKTKSPNPIAQPIKKTPSVPNRLLSKVISSL